MQDRDPAAKVILRGWIVSTRKPSNIDMGSQMRINPRDVSAFELRREGRQPSLWLPFRGVFSPQGLIRITCLVVGNSNCAARSNDLGDLFAVSPADGLRQGYDSILGSPGINQSVLASYYGEKMDNSRAGR